MPARERESEGERERETERERDRETEKERQREHTAVHGVRAGVPRGCGHSEGAHGSCAARSSHRRKTGGALIV